MTFQRLLIAALAVVLVIPLSASALPSDGPNYIVDDDVTKTDNVEQVAHIPYVGGSEVDSDGERYLFAGEANLNDGLSRQAISQGTGGLRIIDLHGEVDPATGEQVVEPYEEVGFLDCPGTDNYVRYLDPEVYNTEAGDGEFVVMAFHGNACTARRTDWSLENDPHTYSGYGAYNGIMIIDVSDKSNPTIASVIGHDSAHTVMPHPTRPYLYILPGGTANGVDSNALNDKPERLAPTGIIDASDPTDLQYAAYFAHNVQGCHDLGFTHDGDYAYCAGLQEVQVWDISGDNVTSPQVTGFIHNPAIMFAHNVVVSPSGQYLAINDEAFGFHTCNTDAAELYGSLWIYDISVPEVPVLAGKIAPPGHPNPDHITGSYIGAGPIEGWAGSWCAAHNYNWVPGNDDVIVASWFAGGVTAHDMSDPMNPELLAHYMPHDGVSWSGHYYAGYIVSNDMARGLEILDVPEVRALEGDDTATAERTALGFGGLPQLATPRVDMSSVLIPDVLPPRPLAPRNPREGGICSLPG